MHDKPMRPKQCPEQDEQKEVIKNVIRLSRT